MDVKDIKVEDDVDEMTYATGEEKPSIAAIVDERPNHLRNKDKDRSCWRTLEPAALHVKEEVVTPAREPSSSRCERRLQERDSDPGSDLSPPRRRGRSGRGGSDSDLSPPRITSRTSSSSVKKGAPVSQDSDDDLSPPRARHERQYHSSRRDRDRDNNQRRKSPHSDRKVTEQQSDDMNKYRVQDSGLRYSKSVREDVKRLKEREKHLMKQIGEDALGKNAKTVHRDRGTGQVRDVEAEKAARSETDKEDEERLARYKQWSQGLKQREDRMDRLHEDVKEMKKPLARYEDDEDREQLLKAKELKEDPMLQFMRRKKEEQKVRESSSRGEAVFSHPVYRGPPPPVNRFGILPGYRWDGVDRSNGFEKRLMDRQAEKMASQEEAYKWSTEDM